MSRLALACLVASPLAAAVVFACSSSTTRTDGETPDNEAAAPDDDATQQTDAAATDAGPDPFVDDSGAAEYDVTLTDGGTLHCWNFGLTLGGFDVEGEQAVTYAPNEGGYKVVLNNKPPNFAQIHQTIDSGIDIHATTLRIDERVTVEGAFDTASSQYSDAIAQYLGGFDDQEARNALIYAGNPVHTELNVWPQGGFDNHSFAQWENGTLPLPTIDGPVWIDTDWTSPNGAVTVSAGKKTVQLDASTSTQPSHAYTLKIGGSLSDGGAPTLTILVRSICLGFR